MPSALAYRPEIDGLRAVAVIAVLLFHLDPDWLPGGFTGVDIFLVISGFLITSIIVRQQQQGSFRASQFYLHRLRRIGPAYFAVVLATLLAALLLMLPDDLRGVARSAGWSALSLPNVYFWLHLDSGYFASDSRQLPLLHLWSLGVEEQFYLLWPLVLLLALHGLPRRWLPALLALPVTASLLHAQQQTLADPSYAYYMLPARAGELGIGCLLGLVAAVRESRQRSGGAVFELVALAGLLLMAWSLLWLGHGQRFPGLMALPACLGAGMVITADSQRRCLVLAPLRWPPVVWIGLISYSLYLWHWPVLALLRYRAVPLEPLHLLLVGAGLVGLAALSHRYIERPVRQLRWRARTQLVWLWIVPVAGILLAAVALDRYASRITDAAGDLSAEQQQALLLQQTAPAYEYAYNCQLSEHDPDVLQRPACVHGRPDDAPPDILLWGDSHAAHYIGVLGTLAEDRGLRIRNASLSTCPPVFSSRTDYGQAQYQQHCTRFRALLEQGVGPYRTVILGASWTVHRRHPGFEQDFQQTVDRLLAAGKQVVIMAEAPRFPGYERQCAIRNLGSSLVDCRQAATRPDTGSNADALAGLLANHPAVQVMDIHALLCHEGQCSAYLDDKAVYYDPGHLSMQGSWQLGARYVAQGMPVPAALAGKGPAPR